jgi:NAD(P)-dependent dehydrogenase (short-subunit alcohol dehydrogenase family)
MADSTRPLAGRVAIVTGAARGIGAAACIALAERGAKVIAAVRDPGRVAPDTFAAAGDAIAVHRCDVADNGDVEKLVAGVVDQFGRLDILVNNAGTIEPIGRIADTDPALWLHSITVNLAGAYYGIRAALPHLPAGGVITNLSSGAAHQPREGWSAYCSAKAGLFMLTRAIAHEYGGAVRAYGFQPGVVDTDMQGLIRASGMNEISRLKREQLRPVSDPARVIAWLCSDEATDLAGQELSIADATLRARAGLAA